MNEDEVEIVVNFLKHKNLNEESLKKSTNDVIEKAVELIGLLEEMDSSIERIHFHTASI
jgi:ADP-dependent phosphofructokinase/glucokinase